MFHSLHQEFKNVDFLTVYITEAHAQDEWPITSSRYSYDKRPVLVQQPQTTEERCKVALDFVNNYSYKIPLVVDLIHNTFEATYAPWPIRLYILRRDTCGVVRVCFIAMPQRCSYDITQVKQWLEQFAQ